MKQFLILAFCFVSFNIFGQSSGGGGTVQLKDSITTVIIPTKATNTRVPSEKAVVDLINLNRDTLMQVEIISGVLKLRDGVKIWEVPMSTTDRDTIITALYSNDTLRLQDGKRLWKIPLPTSDYYDEIVPYTVNSKIIGSIHIKPNGKRDTIQIQNIGVNSSIARGELSDSTAILRNALRDTAFAIRSDFPIVTPNYTRVTQAAHGFTIGKWVVHNGTDYVLASNTSANLVEAPNLIVGVTANTFDLISEGYTTVLSGLNPGNTYWISTSGNLTSTAPTTGLSRAVFRAVSATTGFVIQQPTVNLNANGAGLANFTNTGTGGASYSSATGTLNIPTVRQTTKYVLLNTPPTTTEDTVQLFFCKTAERMELAVNGKFNDVSVMQRSFNNRDISYFHTNGGTGISVTGYGNVTTVGTGSAATSSAGSVKNHKPRTVYTTTATAGTLASIRSNTTDCYGGEIINTKPVGGYYFDCEFGMNSLSNNSNFFCGLRAATAAPKNVDPTISNVLGQIGMGFGSFPGNYKLIHNIAGSAPTVIDLPNFPINTTDYYKLVIYTPHNSDNTYVEIQNLQTGTVNNFIISTNKPTKATMLTRCMYLCNDTDNAAVAFVITKMNIETK